MSHNKPPTQDDFRHYILPDGRRLAWCERGDPDGSPIFAFHGLPGSRLQAHPDEAIACTAGARVIHVDRPGFGFSDPMPARRLGDWPNDIRMLADHLRIGRFAVAGVSGGGPFACACAAQLEDRITRAAIISGVGPPLSMLGSKSWVVRTGFRVAASVPWLIMPPMAVAALAGLQAPGFFLDRLNERLPVCDRDILRRPEIRTMLMQDLRAAFRNGARAFLEDLQLEARPWRIPLERIACPVTLWHGSRDTIVPPAATEALAALLRHASVRIFPEKGHFFVFEVWRDLLTWLLNNTIPDVIA
jgi:pimeloyl-ACP methyl ester carboxylesterase